MVIKTPKIEIHNVATGELSVREMTDSELIQLKADETEGQARAVAVQAKAEAKAAAQAKLAALGLTVGDLQALGL